MLSFIFDLSEDSLQKIRLHTGFGFFLGSNWSSVYYEKNEIELGICTFEKSKTINDYINLTKNVEKKFWCSEIDKNKDLISIKYNGYFINEDILRVQSTISNLAQIEKFDFNKVIEIGAGYGLLSNQINRVFNCNQVVIVDHPEILYWNAIYTFLNDPKAKIQIISEINEEISECDYVFVPSFLAEKVLVESEFDLLVNENSFCEMTSDQIYHYLSVVKAKLLYSNNRNCQFMNSQLQDLNRLLKSKYSLFPKFNFYSKKYKNLESKHNAKYIFFASEQSINLPNFDPNILNGLTVRTRH
jgi:hypothetical protein